jgi:hypothetical protein
MLCRATVDEARIFATPVDPATRSMGALSRC